MMDNYWGMVVGSLLHDIGKVVYRAGDKNNHSKSGYNYLKGEVNILKSEQGKEVLQSVLYHHANQLKTNKIADDSTAYITYIADNIASASDRRESVDPEPGFDKKLPLESIFNKLNGNDGCCYYKPKMLGKCVEINYPVKERVEFTQVQYSEIKAQITDCLNGIKWDNKYVNSLLEILEATLSYVPSSTSKKEVADISLYDHLKITAAVSSCIYQWLEEQKISDYKTELFINSTDFYAKKAFMLFSIDISGIQKFIYTVTGADSLKILRSKSFYLEIFMENFIDEILDSLELSRANLIYCGGGHMYALLPNTVAAKCKIAEMEKMANAWLRKKFDTALFVACGYVECSAMELTNGNVIKDNKNKNLYKNLYKQLGKMISRKKSNRYSAEEIIQLNSQKMGNGERECRICRSVVKVNEDNLCHMCQGFAKLSDGVLNKDFFAIIEEEEANSIPIFEGLWMISQSKDELKKRIANGSCKRAYSKNEYYSGDGLATKLWVGNYTIPHSSMEEYAKAADGIDRVAVLRMDVDNLGQAFVSGFENDKFGDRYVTLSRTATFSRQMTLFFKYHINRILEKPTCCALSDNENESGRQISVVYSGGDDVFLVGAWNDVVEAAVDIRNAFKKYSQGRLSISGGIGLYSSSYPIHVMANEVGDLEDNSKNGGKNALTIFEKTTEIDGKEKGGFYNWDVFEQDVMGEKYSLLKSFFDSSDERGKSFLYRILELIRNTDKKINIARFMYMLARLEPKPGADEEQKEKYKEFRTNMLRWYRNSEERRKLITAIYLYVYHERCSKNEEE